MATTRAEIPAERIEDHETAGQSLEVRITARRLQDCGLTLIEATNLTAHLVGLPPARTGWDLRQVEHLLFLRSIITSGRLQP